jgi:indolepyruvate ferredoxin oxidoreductase, beta subunit
MTMHKLVEGEGNLIIAGVGGQGVILASNIVAEVCLTSGLDVKKAEVHGMSQRGGVVTSQVRFAPVVHSVLIEPGQVDYVVAFEWAEALRWLGYLREGGMAYTSRERIIPPAAFSDHLHGRFAYPLEEVDHPQLAVIDAFALATEAGDGRAQGTVLLGALSHRLPFPTEAWCDAIARWVPVKAVKVNLKAFDLGREFQPSIQVRSPVPTRPPELRANYQVTIESAWCKGCAICLDVCPERCFVLDEQDIAVAVHQERCTGCQLCVKLCPDFAIEIGLVEQIREREGAYHAR